MRFGRILSDALARPKYGAPANSCHAVCRFHEMNREHVWKLRMPSILNFLSEIVIAYVCTTNVSDLTRRLEIYM